MNDKADLLKIRLVIYIREFVWQFRYSTDFTICKYKISKSSKSPTKNKKLLKD